MRELLLAAAILIHVDPGLANPGAPCRTAVEAEDPKVVASFVSKYVYWNDVNVVPVVDVGEIVPIDLESLA